MVLLLAKAGSVFAGWPVLPVCEQPPPNLPLKGGGVG
jgi:hypothetical protein